MSSPFLNFDEFELPFIVEGENASSTDEESTEAVHGNISSDAQKELMESMLPKLAIYLGTVETEINNWTSWVVKDYFYLCPLKNEEYDWAFFRISWDDNWNTWNWSFDCRLNGFADNYKEAARFILPELYKKWRIDLSDLQNETYLDVLDSI